MRAKNRARRGRARRLWWLQGQGRERSMARFSPQPAGTGPIFPISSSFVAHRHPVCVAPLSSISKKSAPVASVRVVLTGPRSGSVYQGGFGPFLVQVCRLSAGYRRALCGTIHRVMKILQFPMQQGGGGKAWRREAGDAIRLPCAREPLREALIKSMF